MCKNLPIGFVRFFGPFFYFKIIQWEREVRRGEAAQGGVEVAGRTEEQEEEEDEEIDIPDHCHRSGLTPAIMR